MSNIESELAGRDEFNQAINDAIAEATPEPEPEVEATPETEPEPELEPEAAEEAVEEAEQKLYAGQYKTVEALEKAVAEKEAMIQRQAAEVGEARRLREEAEQTLAAQPPQIDPQAPQVVETLVDQGRYQEAAEYALRTNPYMYQGVLEAWMDEPGQRLAAIDYHAGLRERNLTEQFQRTLREQVSPDTEKAIQFANRSQLNEALGAVAARHPDFGEVVGSVSEERLSEIVDGGFPIAVLERLNGERPDQEAVFETLYRWVKAEQTDTLSAAAEEAVSRSRQESRQRKAEAAVASATTNPSVEDQPPQTPEEALAKQIGEEWGTLYNERSVTGAWSGRDSRGTPR